MALRQQVRSQFKAHAKEEDPTKIEGFKSDAVRALSNFMIFESAKKDTHLQKAMNLNNVNNNKNNSYVKKDKKGSNSENQQKQDGDTNDGDRR